MMDTIIREAELHLNEWGISTSSIAEFLVMTLSPSHELPRSWLRDHSKSVVVFTLSGMSALWMSKTKPSVPIYAFTPETRTYQWLGICRGVTALRVPHADTLETMITHVETALSAATDMKKGDQVIVISGFPVGKFSAPNLALLYTLRN